MDIPYSRPAITQEDARLVTEALMSGWVAGNGPKVRAFERLLCEYTGYKFAVATCNATVALYTAYRFAFSREDVPIEIPDLTFIATANMLVPLGYRMSVKDCAPSRATETDDISVSYAGYPVSNGRVADDAHYIYPGMARWKGHLISVLSFHALKPITTGEGGAILTNSRLVYEQVRSFVDQGRNKDGYGYGFNFRMPEINAALGISQLKKADENTRLRTAVAERYLSGLSGIDGLSLPESHPRHSWHLFVVEVSGTMTRGKLAIHLENAGIETRVHYKPVSFYQHMYAFREKLVDNPGAANTYWNCLSIPIFAGISPVEVQYVIDKIKEFFV